MCCWRDWVNRYNYAAVHSTMSFRLFPFKSVWFDFHEHCNIIILLKPVATFQFALNSYTVTDSGHKEVPTRMSSLNMHLTWSFCTPWRYVGQWGSATLIRNFDTTWKQVVNCTLATWPQRYINRCRFKKSLGGSAPVCTFWRKENV